MKIILGSASENRRRVLRAARYDFEVMSADIDEKAIRHENLYEIPVLLAKAKAVALFPKIKEPAFLITADQVIVWNGKLREKATSIEEARHFLEMFSGSEFSAEHVNGITVTNTATGRSLTEREISRVYFSKIPREIINTFLAEGIWGKYAGGYGVDHPLLAPFIRLEGTMESALGLPLGIVERNMKELF